MTIHYEDATVTLYAGDCLDVLRELPDASVDAVVTDPPYGLSFMGKEWDKPTPRAAACEECGNDDPAEGYRVCSDCLPAVGDTARISDHGGKAMLGHVSTNWHEKGTHSRGYADHDNVAFQAWCQQWTAECFRVLKPGGHLLAFGGTRTWHRLACAVEDAGFEVRDSIAWLYGSGFPKSLDVSKAIDKAAGAEREVTGSGENYGRSRLADGKTAFGDYAGSWDVTAPATDDARTWQGWGTALKPAFEPVVVARKPLAGTVAGNVLAWGTGALNVDACRIETDERIPNHHGTNGAAGVTFGNRREYVPGSASPANTHTAGRWPANVVLDESQADALDTMSGTLTSNAGTYRREAPAEGERSSYRIDPAQGSVTSLGDSGGASRFFYVAKADASERVRVAGVSHPTVKPLALMRWLVRLVTPPGGVVLEPFAGSGTTVEACILEGFRCIAIEREPDYLPLIVQRINRRRDPVQAVKATGDDGGLFDLLEGEGA